MVYKTSSSGIHKPLIMLNDGNTIYWTFTTSLTALSGLYLSFPLIFITFDTADSMANSTNRKGSWEWLSSVYKIGELISRGAKQWLQAVWISAPISSLFHTQAPLAEGNSRGVSQRTPQAALIYTSNPASTAHCLFLLALLNPSHPGPRQYSLSSMKTFQGSSGGRPERSLFLL